MRSRLEKASVNEGRAGLGRIVVLAAVDALASRSEAGTMDALRHNRRHEDWLARHSAGGVGTGGARVPTDPEWAESGYNSFHIQEDGRGFADRSPDEWAALAAAEADVDRDFPKERRTAGSA